MELKNISFQKLFLCSRKPKFRILDIKILLWKLLHEINNAIECPSINIRLLNNLEGKHSLLTKFVSYYKRKKKMSQNLSKTAT